MDILILGQFKQKKNLENQDIFGENIFCNFISVFKNLSC